ncbi:MAG: HIT domain-containing protein [Bacteroidetes bacterium]|nr:HIT domain-containing protein [Bacteroidota bacterium]
MKRLWSPWRSAYIDTFSEDASGKAGCIFCDYPLLDQDEGKLIIFRGVHAFVIMNLFPYNSGHLMVVPYLHTRDLDELTPECSVEIIQLLARSKNALTKALSAQGFNLGVNLGKAAGAGIDDHIHFHIVPRWNGDTNFMPVFADIKVVPEEIRKTYQKLKQIF